MLSKVKLDQRALRQFDRERASIGSLSGHPNIVTVYEAGVTDAGFPYLAMEYLPNGSLADRLAEHGPLPWPEVARIGVRLSGALESAHEAGILHRDLKPENVLMSGFGEPELSDFGIARVLSSPETRTTDHAVSVAHAAPEVLDGSRFSRQSDVYSLGSTLFTLLWGSPPFLRDDELLLSLLVRITRLPPPDLRARGIPDPMCLALERAMAKRPADRHGSAADLAEELQQAQAAAGHVVTVPFVTGSTAPPPGGGPASPWAATPVPVISATQPHRPDAPPQRRARTLWFLLALPVLVVGAVLATLRGDQGRTGSPGVGVTVVDGQTTSSAASTSTLPAIPFPRGTEPVKAGRYVATQFPTPFEFELAEGWRATAEGGENQLELVRTGGDGVSGLTLMRVSRVFDAQLAPTTADETRSAVRSEPADLVQWVQTHPRLAVGDAVPVKKGALTGTALDVRVSLGYPHPDCQAARAGQRCVLLFVTSDQVSYGLQEGYRAMFYVLRLGNETLVTTVEAPVAEYERFAQDADRVLATLRPRG